MTQKERTFLIELIIKLDVVIDAEHEKVNFAGLNLILDFTVEKRKKDILKALNILSCQRKSKGEKYER